MLLGVNLAPPEKQKEDPLRTVMIPEQPRDFLEERKVRDVFTRIHENVQPLEVPLPELPDAKPPEPLEDIPEEKPEALPYRQLPQEDLTDIPLELLRPAEVGRLGTMGVGASGRAGSLALRGDRGLRLKAAKRGGGGPDTESAVERALAWLARNQDKDGSWGLDGRSGAPTATGWWRSRGKGMRPAMTGFSVLAFLGAGYSHKGGHKYAAKVRQGLEWLVENQPADGSATGRTKKCGYSQAVVTLALAEAVAMAGSYSRTTADFDRKLRRAAQKGVDFICKSQNPYGGWDYMVRGGESDTSITVWNCMALKSARVAGFKVDGVAFQGIVSWLNRAQYLREGEGSGTEWAGGRFAYRSRGKGLTRRRTAVTVMHPAGLMMRLMTGTRPDRREAYGPANMLLKLVPEKPEKEVPEEQVRQLVEEFIQKHFMSWDSLTLEQKQAVKLRAKRAVDSYPRTAEAYLKLHYGAHWQHLSEGQRAALRETAKRAVASYPRTVEAYIDRNYRKWKTFSAEERVRQRKYARRVVERQLYGGSFPESIYFLYHSSLAMFQMGGEHWKAWNHQMKRVLLDNQVRGGDDDGSWQPARNYGMCTCVGRTMSTALGAMTLEVYYRYLRIYDTK
jgi:hypothetical protein